MGIPKFFRWLSERYPLINQDIKAGTVFPEFDNLYLDMNGIIHPCTHGNDGEVVRMSENDMFVAIGKFVDELMKVVRPQRLLFMAVDGCAPRAKMNQQRQRRFRSASELSKSLMNARERGEEIPQDPFDSNCITPGTQFMARLTNFLNYFIQTKIKDDPIWAKAKIILSGAEVPGEGEHKIMEYIRREKSQESWPPNLRHCIFGNDADLIMLSLATHEPHFALLRETFDVRPPRRNKDGTTNRPNKAEIEEKNRSKGFQLLHIGILRDYLWLEFQDVASVFADKGGLNLERVVDDFVLICYLIGNDFLPHLPFLDILTGALNDLLQIYKELLPVWGDYLTICGEIDLPRLGMLFPKVADIERRVLKQQLEDMKNDASLSEFDSVAFQEYKDAYYMRKFGLQPSDTEGHKALRQHYIEGIMWCYSYYYNGCISWGWFYPYHHTPFASDLIDLEEMEISFDLGKPFKPFQQLLGVLPIASRKLLPEAFACLMDSAVSPLNRAGFYPLEFEVDMEGKKFDWEGIAIIPFIDADLLVTEHDKVSDVLLTDEEKKRNSFGRNRLYEYDENVLDQLSSPVPNLPDLIPTCCRISEYNWPEFAIERGGRFLPVLCEGVKVGKDSEAGFPSLFSCPHKFHHEIMNAKVNIFGRPSSRESIVIIFDEIQQRSATEFQDLIGNEFLVGWPYLTDCSIRSVSDSTWTIKGPHGNLNVRKKPEETSWKFSRDAELHRSNILTKKGIDVGTIDVIFDAAFINGKVLSPHGKIMKRFEEKSNEIPWQLSSTCAPELQKKLEDSTKDFKSTYPVGSKVICLRKPLRGEVCTIKDNANGSLLVELTVTPSVKYEEQFFGERLLNDDDMAWFDIQQVSRALRISGLVMSRITSSLRMKGGDDVGLNIKFDKKNFCMPGYARKQGTQWELSQKAFDIIGEYKQKFPLLFSGLAQADSDMREIDPAKVFKEADDPSSYLTEIKKWIKSKEIARLPLISASVFACGTHLIEKMEACGDALVEMIEKAVKVTKKEQLRPTDVILPRHDVVPAAVSSDQQKLEVGDRVVNILAGGPIPLGAKGTVVCVESPFVDVVFDRKVVSLNTLGGRCSEFRGYRMNEESVLCLSDRSRNKHKLSSEASWKNSILGNSKFHESNQAHRQHANRSAVHAGPAPQPQHAGNGVRILQHQGQHQVNGQNHEVFHDSAIIAAGSARHHPQIFPQDPAVISATPMMPHPHSHPHPQAPFPAPAAGPNEFAGLHRMLGRMNISTSLPQEGHAARMGQHPPPPPMPFDSAIIAAGSVTLGAPVSAPLPHAPPQHALPSMSRAAARAAYYSQGRGGQPTPMAGRGGYAEAPQAPGVDQPRARGGGHYNPTARGGQAARGRGGFRGQRGRGRGQA